jgi:dTDP-4-dehydrorhamnose 3,5-epimerase
VNAAPFRCLDAAAVRRDDDRGHLDVLFEEGDVVLKRSFSRAGVFRGMHWQRPPSAQTKIIRVVSGRILDFVMDPLQTEPRLHRREIGPADGWILIGAELAHGFYALEDTVFEYLCIGAYDESAEACFSIAVVLRDALGLEPLLSPKDRAAAPAMAALAPAGEGA